MKYFISLLMLVNTSFVQSGGIGDFTILSIGGSNNTNTVYIETIETIMNTTCSNKHIFRLPDSDKNADRFFSLSMAAQAQGKKITIGYEVDQCIEGSTLIRVFKLLT